MQVLIMINVIGTIVNVGLILFLYYELKRLRFDFNDEKASQQEVKTRIEELTEAVKYLTKLSIDKFKNNKERNKVIPFKPEDVDKIKDMIDVSH